MNFTIIYEHPRILCNIYVLFCYSLLEYCLFRIRIKLKSYNSVTFNKSEVTIVFYYNDVI